MLASGRYLWNAGIFLFRAERDARPSRAMPRDLLAAVAAALAGARADLGFLRLGAQALAGAARIPSTMR